MITSLSTVSRIRGRPTGGRFARLPPSGISVASNTKAGERKTISRYVVLASYRATGSGASPVAPDATIYSPSARLRLSISLAWETQTSVVQAGTWTLTSQRLRLVQSTGAFAAQPSTIDLNTIFSNRALPDAYEMDSAARRLHITTSLAVAGGPNAQGDWVLQVVWEPNSPIETGELERLYSACGITAQNLSL